MTIFELIEEIKDRYIVPKDDDGRTDKLLQKDFGFYSPSKLEKIWYAIKRYHKSNFAPNYSAIVDCMDKSNIGESQQNSSKWYQRCSTCGCKYAVNVCACPKCNKHLPYPDGSPEIFRNQVEIIKCEALPHDVIFTREACPICPIFRSNSIYPRGIKCDSFHGEMRGQLPDCEKCVCHDCCMDLGSKNEDMPSGALMGVVDNLVGKAKVKKLKRNDHVGE